MKENKSCWEYLGIEATADKEEIRKAYFTRLPYFHPEENPEGFKDLRKAMEEALMQAGEIENDQEDGLRAAEMLGGEEIQGLLKAAEELYQDYSCRIQPDKWAELIQHPACRDLETQSQAGMALLGFFMDHFHLPAPCLVVLNDYFGWTGEEGLADQFPEGYIEYLFDQIEGEEDFRYDLVKPGMGIDCEKYCQAYFDLRSAINQKDKETADQILETLKGVKLYHPDMEVLKIRHTLMHQGKEEEAFRLAERLYQEDGQNPTARYFFARTALNYQKSEVEDETLSKLINELVSSDPEDCNYMVLLGNYLRHVGDLASALNAYQEADRLYGEKWEYIESLIQDTAKDLAFQMENGEYGDIENWNLAHICYMGGIYNRVVELLSETDPPKEKEMSWLFMMARSCYELKDYEKAATYRRNIWDLLAPEERPLELYLDLAEAYALSGQKDQAQEFYDKAIADFPEEREPLFKKAELLLENSRKQEALELCRRMLKIGFEPEAFHMYLEILVDLEQYQEAREKAEHLFAQGFESATSRYQYAKALRKLKEWEKAEAVLKDLLEKTGGAPVVYQEYAGLCSDTDRTEEALKLIDQAIAGQDTATRQFIRGGYLHDLERYEEEAALYLTLMKQGADGYYIHFRLGQAYEEMERYEEAEGCYRKSVGLNPEAFRIWDYLGDVLQNQGKWEEAAEAYRTGADGGDVQAARDLCRILKRLYRTEEAAEEARLRISRDPDDPILFSIYAKILSRQENYDEARKCYGRYMELKPSQTAYAYKEIALLYEKEKDYGKAEEYFRKAIEESPEDAVYWQAIGKHFFKEQKDPEKALSYLEKAMELGDERTYGWMLLGELYDALGRSGEARKCYEKSLKNYQKKLQENPKNCCTYEGIADVLFHLGRLDEAEEIARQGIARQNWAFTCNKCVCYEGYEDLSKIEEKRGNYEKALEYMEIAGQNSTTGFYPKEIARLKEIVKNL